MDRPFFIALVALSLLAPVEAKEAGRNQPGKDLYVLQFPAGVNPADFTIESWLLAKSGFHMGNGKIIGTQCAIDLTGADELRVIVFSPKYQSVLINVPVLSKEPQRNIPVDLRPAGTVPFKGKIDLPAGLDGKDYRLEVSFEWQEGRFVNYVPGPPAKFTATTVDLEHDGSFRTTMPDLFHDPEIARWGGVGIGDASLHLVLRPKQPGRKTSPLRINVPSGGECFQEVKEHYEEIHLEGVRKAR